jgi:hypothetical protein
MSDKTPRSDEQSFPGEWQDSVVDTDFARELERENNELRELVNFFTIEEKFASGRTFNPNAIDSCRAMDGARMVEIIEKYRD